ncbi:MerR family transcriptional regulator [Enterococcus cecorum]|uniref:MerR family transcriptional regulator n=1 Tax=Enterococcus cecorum TaxID=44008 RepID=UPI00148D0D43|nr:MerR family transcriptional regulator [Enterococcus cecorum]
MNIKKAAELFDLSVDTLRYYERIGVIPPVKRNESGYREYSNADLNWIYLAKSLRNAGLSIESLIEYVQLSQTQNRLNVADAQKQILHDQLTELSNKIEEMQQAKGLLQYKIATFDEHLAKFQSGEMNKDTIDKLWEKKF